MIITRFAPSPTGYLHIGSIRIALYSWIFAKQNSGKFFIRIENTDKNKSNKKFINFILKNLKWLGLDWDNNIFIQTNKINIYNKIINEFIDSNLAYPCFCSKERIRSLKKYQLFNKINTKYDGYCRNNNFSKKDLCNKNYVIRFKTPINSYIFFNDWIHGKIEFNNNELDDFIIKRENGMPTYNFCSVIDDIDMNITHIIRGSDHISNTPKQINILKSINKKIPEYIHIPIILDENKNKLSKKNSLINIEYFKKIGILPDSILHYLISINNTKIDEKKNIIEKKDYINYFSINKISKSQIIFNNKKLLWINKNYLLNLSNNIIYKYSKKYIKEFNYDKNIYIYLKNIIMFFKDRSYSLKNMFINSEYIYKDIKINNNIIKKYINTNNICIIKNLIINIVNLKDWEINNIKNIIENLLNNYNKDIKKHFYFLIRILLSGKEFTPSIYIIIYLLGKNITIKRLNKINI